MPHQTPLISMIVLGLVLAFVFAVLLQRLRVSALVGYLLAGVVIGPFTPGFVGDVQLANELAELGVILLMFGVGCISRWRTFSRSAPSRSRAPSSRSPW
jgi:monovalent cation:H+ antiporter-2, CPA2 family